MSIIIIALSATAGVIVLIMGTALWVANKVTEGDDGNQNYPGS